MLAPQFPPNESARLASLRAMHILDTPIEDRFERLTRMARRSFDVSIAVISLIDEERQWFKSIQGLDVCETSRDVSFCGHALLSDEVMVVPDAQLDERFHDNPLVVDGPRIRFYAGCPLRGPDGYTLGTLCLIDPVPRAFTDEDIASLRDLAIMAENEFRLRLMSRAQDSLLQELDRTRLAASVDPLTRIWNRGAILEILSREMLQPHEQDKGVGLIMIDFDHFKRINDEYGHLAGDAVLREGASRMLGVVRDADALGRYGGEEFMAVITGCPVGHVAEVAERIRASIAGNPMDVGGKVLDVAASLGCAWCAGGPTDSVDSLIELADGAMYRAKRQGRNRIEFQP